MLGICTLDSQPEVDFIDRSLESMQSFCVFAKHKMKVDNYLESGTFVCHTD